MRYWLARTANANYEKICHVIFGYNCKNPLWADNPNIWCRLAYIRQSLRSWCIYLRSAFLRRGSYVLISVLSFSEQGISERLRAIIVPEGRWDTSSYLGVISLPTLLTVIVFACTRRPLCSPHHILSSTFIPFPPTTSKCHLHLSALPVLINLPPFLRPPSFCFASPPSLNCSQLLVLDGIYSSSVCVVTFSWRAFGKRVSLLRCVALSLTALVTEISGYGSCSTWIVCNMDMAMTTTTMMMIMVPELFS